MAGAATLKSLVEAIYPLHRTLASDGTDEALEIIGAHLGEAADWRVERFPAGERAWTWRIPERWVVHEAFLEIEGGRRIADFADNPLHVVSYSEPVDRVLTWEELEPHLHVSDKRPRAIPWEFKFYERSWGFCLSKEIYDELPRDARYRAVIRSEFDADPARGLAVGVAVVPPQGPPADEPLELLVAAHVCHPMQANDDASGVATAVEVARRLLERPLPPGSMQVRFLFGPETIGSICYLSRHEDLIPRMRGAVFCEMTGNRNSLALQRTRQDDHLMDRIARDVLERRGLEFREGAFRQVIGNDEMVINGPGVNVPCISISRWPYDEYHTSDDTPDIIHEELLVEAADVVEEVVRLAATNYVPRRTFRGPVFLSGYGLWVDWREDFALNRALEQIMLRLEGDHSLYDIASELGLDYWVVRDYVERFRAHGLVEALPVPPAD